MRRGSRAFAQVDIVSAQAARRPLVWLALVLSLLFVVLTVLVLRGVTQPLDAAVLQRLRPDGVWGEAQLRYTPWMSRLGPQHVFLLLTGTTVAASVWHRSWWPLAFSSALTAASAGITLIVKFASHRPDSRGFVTETGGSYPSGHTVALVICLSGCLLVVWPRVRWWMWAPVVIAALLLSSALLLSGAHWFTDVLGGILLALAIVLVLSRSELRQRAHRRGA